MHVRDNPYFFVLPVENGKQKYHYNIIKEIIKLDVSLIISPLYILLFVGDTVYLLGPKYHLLYEVMCPSVV